MGSNELVQVCIDIDKLKTAVVGDRHYRDRVSCALAIRMATAVPGEIPYVFDEIDFLEGIQPSSATKAESGFKNKRLADFRKKHFFAPRRHYLKNLGVRWNLDRGGNSDLTTALEEVATHFGNDIERWPVEVGNRMSHGFVERIGRLTGDWIVFAKHEGVNYYLDLALHSEGFDGEALYSKLRNGNVSEFPFLFGE